MSSISFYISELFHFTLKQIRACVFAGSFFVLLFASNYISIPGLARYDVIFLGAVLIQVVLYLLKIETKDEIKTIFIFHIIGMCLELFKTHPSIATWSYPEASFFKLFHVPLYTGFMYAAVGSYIAQAWRLFQLRITNFPPMKYSVILGAIIYLNFFTNEFFYDIRYFLGLAVVLLFMHTTVHFTIRKKEYWMPLVVSFVLIAFFLWIAENISTLLGAWQYPHQQEGWNIISLNLIGSWTLLVIISFILVADLKLVKEGRNLG